MVRARTEFLNKGYYAPLANKLAEIIKEFEPSILIDAGCGEGYYTEQIAHQLENGHVYGLDISKDALLDASKRCKTATFAVASTSSMPFN